MAKCDSAYVHECPNTIFGIFNLTCPEEDVLADGTQSMSLPVPIYVSMPSLRSLGPRFVLVPSLALLASHTPTGRGVNRNSHTE